MINTVMEYTKKTSRVKNKIIFSLKFIEIQPQEE